MGVGSCTGLLGEEAISRFTMGRKKVNIKLDMPTRKQPPREAKSSVLQEKRKLKRASVTITKRTSLLERKLAKLQGVVKRYSLEWQKALAAGKHAFEELRQYVAECEAVQSAERLRRGDSSVQNQQQLLEHQQPATLLNEMNHQDLAQQPGWVLDQQAVARSTVVLAGDSNSSDAAGPLTKVIHTDERMLLEKSLDSLEKAMDDRLAEHVGNIANGKALMT